MSQVDNLDELLWQLRSQAQKENYAKVIFLASQILELESSSAEAYYLRGNAKAGLGNLADAIVDMTSTLKIEPNHMLALIKRAEYAKLI